MDGIYGTSYICNVKSISIVTKHNLKYFPKKINIQNVISNFNQQKSFSNQFYFNFVESFSNLIIFLAENFKQIIFFLKFFTWMNSENIKYCFRLHRNVRAVIWFLFGMGVGCAMGFWMFIKFVTWWNFGMPIM
jgi:hypothetical protein